MSAKDIKNLPASVLARFLNLAERKSDNIAIGVIEENV
jgi:hypothetical protein